MTFKGTDIGGQDMDKDGGVPASPSGCQPTASAAEEASSLSGIPNATINHDLCIGIVNPYGTMWTWDAFGTCDEAEQHLRDFWGKDADEMVPQFKLCMVRVEVIPESAPFDMPSAQGTEAQRATTENTGVVHDGPVPEGNAP